MFQLPLPARLSANAGARSLRLASLLVLAGVFVGGRIQSAEAAASDWTGAASADWFVGGNWTGGVPNNTTDVVIDQGSPNANPSIGINNTSNTATSSTAVIGDLTGTTGTVTVSTTNALLPASWTLSGTAPVVNINIVAGPLVVGGSGTGFLTITNGGAVTTTGSQGTVVIGSVGAGTVTVGSATTPNLANLSTLSNNGTPISGRLVVGDTGIGTLIINPDGLVNAFNLVQLGDATGGQGSLTVNGGTLNATVPLSGTGEIDAGVSGRGTLTIENGGTATSLVGNVAVGLGSAGSSATVTGANSIWNITGGFNFGGLGIGSGDAGSLSILAGGTVSAPGLQTVTIGSAPNSTAAGVGTVTVDDGKLTANGAVLYVGAAGNPGSTMTLRNGGQVVSDGGSIGGDTPASSSGSSATGLVTVTGAGSLWDAARDSANAVDNNASQFEGSNQFFVDNPTSMTGLIIQQGGQVIDNAAFVSDFSVIGAVNTVVVDGAGSKWTNGTSLSIGYFQSGFGPGLSTGVVNISNGGQVSAPSVTIGMLPDGGSGNIDTISVSGAGSSLQASGTLTVGLFGTGNLTVSAGATVTSGAGIIGYSSAAQGTLTLTESSFGLLDTNSVGANSVGTVTITGAGSTWTNSGNLIVGDNSSTVTNFTGTGGGTATGTLTVANGGAVSSSGNIEVALNAGSTGTINIGAADGQAAAAPGTISAPAIVFGAGTGTIVFNHTSTNYVFGVPIQGPGSVIVDSGTTIFTATNTYTGPTTINGGTLEVDGTIAASSLTSVNNNATLVGAGTVGKTQVNSGGTLAPGKPGVPGTALTIAGNLAFQSGAIYLVQLNPSATTQANVTGTAALAGKVLAAFAPGSYVQKQFDILHSAGLNGTTFASLGTTNLPPAFSASLNYTSTDVFLDLTLNLLQTGGLNVNQQNVANSLNNFFNSGGTLTPNFLNIFALSGGGLANALTQLDGEDATGAERGAFDLMNEFLGLMLDPFSYGAGGGGSGTLGFAPDRQTSLPPDVALAYASLLKAPPPTFAQRWTAWASGFGGSAKSNGDPTIGSNNVTTGTYGYATGLDYHYSPGTALGFSLAGGGTNWNLAQGLGKGRSDAFLAGLYGVTHEGPAYLAGALAFANNWFNTNRTALADQLTARFQGQSYAARLEGGYRVAFPMSNGAAGVTPYGAIQAQNFHTPAYSEADLTGGGFGLSYNAMNATDTRSELGGRFDALTVWGATPVQLRARAAWAHDWVANPALSAAFQGLPGASFVVNGAPVPHDSALTSVGAEMHLTSGWTLLGKFDGEFASSARVYAGTGTLRYSW